MNKDPNNQRPPWYKRPVPADWLAPVFLVSAAAALSSVPLLGPVSAAVAAALVTVAASSLFRGRFGQEDAAERIARDRVATKLEHINLIHALPAGEFARPLSEDEERQASEVQPTPGPLAERYLEKLVELNLENLAAYYTLVKTQTRRSFGATLAVAIVGVFLLLSGLWIGFFAGQEKHTVTYLAAGCGVVTEFISAIFFYLYNRTVRQLRDYHVSLLDVQNILLCFKIVGDTANATAKTAMVREMVTALMNARSVIGPDGDLYATVREKKPHVIATKIPSASD